MNLGSVATTVAVTSVAVLILAGGCAKQPAVTQARVPAPAAPAQLQAPAPAPAPPAPVAAAPEPAPAAPEPAPAAPAPRVAKPADFTENAALKDIYFDLDESDIRQSEVSTLEASAAWLRENPGHLVLIEGHCDERGTPEYNLALGDRRGRSTISYLASLGVPASRMSIISYGKERPVCTEQNEGCWSRNRRSHFLVKAE